MILKEKTSQHIDFNAWLDECPVTWFMLDSDDNQFQLRRSYLFIIEDTEDEEE